jgi:putative hemolysin
MDLATLSLYLSTLIVCLILSAFFSAAETALLSLPRSKIIKLAATHKPKGQLIQEILKRPDDLLGAILLGNNLVNVLGSAVGTALALAFWGPVSLAPAALALTVIFLLTGEVTPKTIAAYEPERVSLAVIRPLRRFMVLVRPAVKALTFLALLILHRAGRPPRKFRQVTKEDLLTLVGFGRREGYLSKAEQEMLQGVLELGGRTAGRIMQPLKAVASLRSDLTVSEALDVVTRIWPYSRYPVFRGQPGAILGYVHLRDLLQADRRLPIRKLVRQSIFVAEEDSVQDLLVRLRRRQLHMAFVRDAAGRTVGLVTLEDVLEEIVGEILDEYDARAASGDKGPGQPAPAAKTPSP